MQPGHPDYYEKALKQEIGYGEGNYGCCLLCSEADEGCLCFYCKCRRCFWYDSIEKLCEYPEFQKKWDEEEPEWFISKVYHQTEKAILCDLRNEWFKHIRILEIWIPLSIIDM